MRKVKIKSLPKAQKMGEFKPSYDWRLSPQENMELNRRAQVAGWNSVDEYRNANWAYNTQPNKPSKPSKPSNLLSELTKENNSKFAVSESTNANPILPRHWTDEAGKQRSASEIKAVEADWEKAHQEQLAAEKERLKKEHEEYKRKQQEFAKEQFGVDLAQLENYEKDDQGQWIPKTERTRQLEARGNDFALGYTAAENVERKNNLPTVGEELIDLAGEIPFALLGTGAYSQAFRALRGARTAAPVFGALAPEIMLAEEPAAGIFESGINLSRPARSAPKPRKPSFDVQPFTEHLSIMNNPYRLKENTLEGILAKINAGDKYGKQFKSIRYTNNPNKGDIALMIAKDESGAPFFYFKANMDNPLHAGRAFSKLDEFIPKGWSIQEPHSLSLDSWSSMMRRAKSGKFAWENAGHVPLNQSAVHRAGTFSDYVIPETMTSGYGADKYYFSNVESAQPYLDKLRGLIPKEITGVRPALGSEYFPGAVAREYQFLQVPNLRLTKLLRGGDISMGIIEQKLDKFALGGPNDPTKPRGRESDFKYKIIEGKYAFTLPDGRPYIVDNEDTANKLSKFIKSGKWGWINEEDGHGYSFGRLGSDSEPKAPMVLKKQDLGKPDFTYQITPTFGQLANLIYNPRVYTSDYNGANIDTEWGNRSGSNLMYTEPYQEKQFYKNQVSPDYENISLKPRARGNYAYSVIIDGEEYSVDHPYEGSHKGYGYVNIPNRGEFEIDYRSGKPELKKAPTRLNNGGDISIPDLRRVKISRLPKHQDTGVVSGKPYAYTANSVGAPNQWVTLPDFSENGMYQVNLKNTNNKQAIDGYVKNQNGQLLSTFPMENVAWEMPEVTVQAKRYTPEEAQRARQAYLQTPEGREEERQRLMQEFVDQQNANKSSLQAAMGNLSLDNPATRAAARNYADYKLGISSPMWGTDKLLTGRNEPTTRDFYRPHESTLSFGVPAAAVTLPIVAEAVPTALSALRPYSQALNNSLNTKLFSNPSIWASPTQQALYNLATPANILRTVGAYDLTHKYLPNAYGDFKNYYITGDPESLKSGLYNSGKGILELGTMTGPIQNEMSMIKRPVSLVDDARKLEKAEDLGSQSYYSLKSFKNILDLARKQGGSIPKAQTGIEYPGVAKDSIPKPGEGYTLPTVYVHGDPAKNETIKNIATSPDTSGAFYKFVDNPRYPARVVTYPYGYPGMPAGHIEAAIWDKEHNLPINLYNSAKTRINRWPKGNKKVASEYLDSAGIRTTDIQLNPYKLATFLKYANTPQNYDFVSNNCADGVCRGLGIDPENVETFNITDPAEVTNYIQDSGKFNIIDSTGNRMSVPEGVGTILNNEIYQPYVKPFIDEGKRQIDDAYNWGKKQVDDTWNYFFKKQGGAVKRVKIKSLPKNWKTK